MNIRRPDRSRTQRRHALVGICLLSFIIMTAPTVWAQPGASPVDETPAEETGSTKGQRTGGEGIKGEHTSGKKGVMNTHQTDSSPDKHGVPGVPGVPGVIVAVVVPVVLFLSILGGVIAALYFRSRKDRELHTTLRAMVEKGEPIPTGLISPPSKKGNDLKKGVLLLTVGVGFSLCMMFIAIWDAEAIKGAGVGLIPTFLGIGYLTVAKLAKKTSRRGKENQSLDALHSEEQQG